MSQPCGHLPESTGPLTGGLNHCWSTLYLGGLSAVTMCCFPEPPYQHREHTCGGWALLTHRCMSQQAWAPPMGADISVLGCRWGPQSHPFPRKPQAMPAGRDRGPRLAQEGRAGGPGAARAGTGASTCQTRAKEQTSFLVTFLFSPFLAATPRGKGKLIS